MSPSPPGQKPAKIVIASHLEVHGDFQMGDAVGPFLELTRPEGRRPQRPAGGDLPTTALLNPFEAAIPLIGREGELKSLETWLEGDSISVHGLIGEGGSGKTRLAAELCGRAEKKGWDAGFVLDKELNRFHQQHNLAQWEWQKPTLVVVDYAAPKAAKLYAWFLELAGKAGQGCRPLRIFLLERHGVSSLGWWHEAFHSGSYDDDMVVGLQYSPKPMALHPILSADTRWQMVEAMFERLGIPKKDFGLFEADRENLRDARWGGQPLYLMMAAVTGQAAGTDALRLRADEMAFKVAGHEERRIASFADEAGIPAALLKHVAAYATLCQGLSLQEVEEIVEEESAALGVQSADRLTVCRALQGALPGQEEGIGAVLPDMVGEAVIVGSLGAGSTQRAHQALLRAANRYWERVIPTAIRTVQDYGLDADRSEQMKAAERRQMVGWIEALGNEARDNRDQLKRLVEQLPLQTVILREAAAKITGWYAATEKQGLSDPGSLAVAQHQLAIRLSQVGRREEALDAALKAVQIWRSLVAERPEAFQTGLAKSLNNLANFLSDLGRREEALDAAKQAEQLYRSLAAERLEAFQPELARSLNNLARSLSDLGRREEALDAAKQVEKLYRSLAVARPEAFQPELAMSLNNLATFLGDLGRREEALDAARQAEKLYRSLAAARPEAFLPELAMSLNNLAKFLSELGRREEALDAARQAEKLYRRLAAAWPEAFQPELAGSLANLAIFLSDLDWREEALGAASQAEKLYRSLAAARPEAFLPELAMSLNNLAKFLSELGRREEALDAAKQAEKLYRSLAEARPEVFLPNLARSLNNLAKSLHELGRREEALDAAKQAEKLYRRLAEARPEAFQPDLAMALNNLANSLSNLGRQEEAFDAAKQAEKLYRILAEARPEAFLPDLAMSLNNLAKCLSDLGRREEALDAAMKSEQFYRRLAEARHELFLPYLTMSLNNMAKFLSDLGQREEALDAVQQAEQHYRALAAARPEVFLPKLAMSLNNRADLLSDLGRREEALETAEEALKKLSPFFLQNPEAYKRLMVTILGNYLRAGQKLDKKPDTELIEPIRAKLDLAGDEDELSKLR